MTKRFEAHKKKGDAVAGLLHDGARSSPRSAAAPTVLARVQNPCEDAVVWAPNSRGVYDRIS